MTTGCRNVVVRFAYVWPDGVAWFEADGDYVIAHTVRSSHTLHLSLNGLEKRLDPGRFIRVHRAHIVNSTTSARSGGTIVETSRPT